MASISLLNPKAEFARAAQALVVNTGTTKGIQDVMRTNLGPKGPMKMLVSGAGDIKITKDGNLLLHEMQIQHPTASLITRASSAQDDMTGDGTTSTVLIIGELLKQAYLYIGDGLHPHILVEGFDQARQQALQILDQIAVPIEINRDNLLSIARTSFKTTVHPQLAELLTGVCVDAVLAIRTEGRPVDLHMVELMEKQHKSATDTQLVKGIVMDHGSRHPDIPNRLENAYILTCNVSMEYEKSEVNSGFFYKTAEECEKFVLAEREFKKVIELKRKVCTAENGKTFVVINQKGIESMFLDMLAKEGIMVLRHAKCRNN